MAGVDQCHLMAGHVQHDEDKRHEAVLPAAAAEAAIDPIDRCRGAPFAGQRITHVAGELGHQQGGRNALARDIAQHNGQAAVGQLDVIVIVAAHQVGWLVEIKEQVAWVLGRLRRKQAALNLVGQLEVALHCLLAQLLLVELCIVDGRGGLRGDAH